ncbi:hypothetical protein VUJ46_07590 [Chryseobacterium sp. MYb264]|uniref:hypothetical protein n=1 Tax=Chryseobacterium sp. MYb264 TaxID=2745153 RepID=UPI002E108D9E|nr:hypothetical protein VUJ46_07590 [Chryseobacterium sp. MYb264]
MKNYSLYFIFAFLISCGEKPKELVNVGASFQQSEELKENPLLMHPITSSIQPKDSTMSTLYGNDIAFMYAQKNSGSDYPENAVLYEVTWQQKPDELWFGAHVPKEIKSVEKITFNDNHSSEYEMFEGKPLKIKSLDADWKNRRKDTVLSQRKAVSP